ncbi:hypothetical protein Ciccas_012203 [Cichlidogyrus casuarinus]|uniref:Ionotropic glutamate receptor L-glutamate and glycine-binding domain-containing protein n=1 Tax=Cichlidogyrus casuarinus TaxID=1844966 RepID=A0ABD2PS47_9PLAT
MNLISSSKVWIFTGFEGSQFSLMTSAPVVINVFTLSIKLTDPNPTSLAEMYLSSYMFFISPILDYQFCPLDYPNAVSINQQFFVGSLNFSTSSEAKLTGYWIVQIGYGIDSAMSTLGVFFYEGLGDKVSFPSYQVATGQLTDVQLKQLMLSKPFRILTIITRPFLFKINKNVALLPSNNLTQLASLVSGPIMNIITHLLSELNITNYIIDVRDKWKVGTKQPNGSWDGVFGEIYYQRFDLLVGPFVSTETRINSFLSTVPFMSFSYKFIYQKSIKTTLQEIFPFFTFISWELWLAILVATLLCGLFIFFGDLIFDNSSDFPLKLALDLVLNSLFQQGNCFSRSSRKGKIGILIIIWLFVIFLFLLLFVANMAAIFTQNSSGVNVLESVANLLRQTTYKYGCFFYSPHTPRFYSTSQER